MILIIASEFVPLLDNHETFADYLIVGHRVKHTQK